MNSQMAFAQTAEQYGMMDFMNIVMKQCWDVCYDRNLNREELATSNIPYSKSERMDACGRKCVAREFEVMILMMETREERDREMMQQMMGQ